MGVYFVIFSWERVKFAKTGRKEIIVVEDLTIRLELCVCLYITLVLAANQIVML
jgi:hypothetical protein